MRHSGHIVRQVLDSVREAEAPGITTMDLERVAERRIKELGAKPAFKGYYDYPCVLCTSVNNEIVHGIPSERRVLKDGDIVSIDCGVVLDGFYGDAAITVPVGDDLSRSCRSCWRLRASRCTTASRSGADRQHGRRRWGRGAAGGGGQRLQRGAGVCRPRHRYQAARGPAGAELRHAGNGPRLRDGMVLAIEPMVNVGAGHAGARRQVDGSDERRQLQRSLRALCCRHEEWAGDSDGVGGRAGL